SSEESVGTSTAQVILFGTIPTTIPPTTPTTDLPVIHDDTLLTPTIPPVAPTIQCTSSFIELTHLTRSRVAARSSPPSSLIRQTLPAPPGLPRRPVVLVLPGQPISIGRPYRTHSNGVLKMLTARKSVPYAISETPCDSSNATSERPSRKRCRSLTLSVPVSSLVRKALSLVRTNLSPPPKRIRDSDSVMIWRLTRGDVYGAIMYLERVYWVCDVLELGGGMIETVVEDADHHVISDGAVEIIYETLGGLGHRIARVDLEVTTMTKRIDALELDNTRLRGMLDVESQRVDRLQRGLSRTQSELRQMCRFRFYDRVRVGRLEAYARTGNLGIAAPKIFRALHHC
ncbi:hypothetical protein Tco_1323958, partial [Tanacetum coccineum]